MAGRDENLRAQKGVAMNLTKRDLVVRIAKETDLAQPVVLQVLQKTLDYIAEALVQGNNVEFRNFGVFEVCERKAKIGRNPRMPTQVVPIPAHKIVKFKSGKVLKKRMAGT